MRQNFEKGTSISEQVTRKSGAKKPGRKHQKRPGQKASDRASASKNRGLQIKNKKMKKYKQGVADYWAGKRDDFPKKP